MVLQMSSSRHESLGAASDFLFDQYDTDGDGLLNQFDFSLFLWDLKSTSNKLLTKEQAHRCWAAVDVNSNGRITANEFKHGVAILWEHDFFVAGVPDLTDVDVEIPSEPATVTAYASTPSPETSSSMSAGTTSTNISRNNSLHKSSESLKPAPLAELTSSPSQQSQSMGESTNPRLSRHKSESRQRPHRDLTLLNLQRRSIDATENGSIEDLIQQLMASQQELQAEQAEIEAAGAMASVEDSDDDEGLIPAPRVRSTNVVDDEVVTVKRLPPNAQRLLRVYMEGDSYKTMAIPANATAGDLLKVIYDKLEVPDWEGGRYALYEIEVPAGSTTVLRELKRNVLISEVEARPNRRIYFREVASLETTPITPITPSSGRPPPATKQRSKLFGFLNK